MAETPEVVTSELQVETSSTEYPLDVDKPVVTDELDSTFKVGPGESKDGGEGKDGGKEPAKDDEKKDAKKDDEKDAKDDDFVVLDGVKIPKATFDKIAQKRVNKSVAKQREAERIAMAERAEREALSRRLEELESKLPKPAEEQPPKLENFETMEEYLEARDSWRDAQKEKKEKKDEPQASYYELPPSEQDRVFMDSLSPEQAQWISEGIKETMKDGAEKFKDFKATVTREDVRISPAMMSLVLQSEMREDVMYYLGKNPEAAKDLHEAAIRDANSALRLLGKIESKIESGWTPSGEKPADTGSIEVGDEVTPPAKPIPQAPEPITPVGSRGTSAKKDPSKMSPAEYQAWRRAGGGR